MNVIEKLMAQAKRSIDFDKPDDWHRGRVLAYIGAKQANPSDLKSWAIKYLEIQQEHTEFIADHIAEDEPTRQSVIDMSEGVEAGLHDIIDELCAQEGHHDPVRA